MNARIATGGFWVTMTPCGAELPQAILQADPSDMNETPEMNETPYKTHDYGLAAYFIARGYFCAGVVPAGDPGRPDRRLFVFVDVEDPKAIEDDWYRYRKEQMSARDYFEKLRTASRMLKENR